MTGRFVRALLVASLAPIAGPASAQSDAPSNEIGLHVALIRMSEFERTEPGFGGRYAYNFTSYFGIESEISFFPRERLNLASGVSNGGRKLEFLVGPKVGLRGEKFGIFGKARPGLMRFGKVFKTVRECTRIDPIPLPEDCFVPENRFAIDLGGVLEYYPTSGSVVRFDLGDTIIHARRKSIVFSPVFTQDIPSRTDHNFQFNIGVGFRF